MKFRNSRAFALPTVLISSIIMLIVMLSAVTSAVAIRVSLDAQYYNQLSKTASDAGVAYAKACMKANLASPGTPQWSDAKPLMPNTDCNGDQLSGFTCATNSVDPRCSMNVVDSNIIVSFSVPVPLPDTSGAFTSISANGSVTFLKSSGGGVWRQYKNSSMNKAESVASSETHWKQISAGDFHTCAIASNDQAYCWGSNSYGQLGDGTNISKSIPTAVNNSSALAGLTIKSIAASNTHTCAIASNDQAYCWGSNGYGALGDSTTISKLTPTVVNTSGALAGLTIKSITAGSMHTCVIASNDQAYCWGSNSYGQLGDGTNINKSTPTAIDTSGVLAGLAIKSIAAGNDHTCVIASNDQAYCWGSNSYGQLGDGTNINKSTPTAIDTSGALAGLTIKSIAAGNNHTCAIASNDQAYCWGYNPGALGDNTSANKATPTAVYASGALVGLSLKSIITGSYHTCAIASNNQVYCWGSNSYGQLGDTTISARLAPTVVNTSGILAGLTIKSITAGTDDTCIIASNSQAYCWGYNSFGQLGDGSFLESSTPTPISTSGVLAGLAIKSIAAGDNHTCVIASNDQAYCWGLNNFNSLGAVTVVDRSIPNAVNTSGALAGLTIKSITAGSMHTCVVASNDQAYCWGYNGNGQLGDTTTVNKSVPTPISTSGALAGLTIKSIAAGNDHTCAIAFNDRAYCWGSNSYGQLGDGTNISKSIPTAVDTSGVLSGLTIKSITAGSMHTCVVASNDQAYCWGYNGNGRLGDTTTVNKSAPTAINTSGALAGLTIKSIVAGSDNTCVIASNYKAYCWGYGFSGAIGDGVASNKYTPTAVSASGALAGLTIKSISASYGRVCAIASNDGAYCWGDNKYGALGDATNVNKYIPTAVYASGALVGLTIKSITAGDYHTCAIASNDQVYCWGANINGQLGVHRIFGSINPISPKTSIGMPLPGSELKWFSY